MLEDEGEESDGMIQSYKSEPGSRARARQSMITFEPGEDVRNNNLLLSVAPLTKIVQ